MAKKFWFKRMYTVKSGEVFVFLGCYALFSLFYYITLWLNRQAYKDPDDPFFDPITFMDDAGLQYLIFFTLSVLIWFFVFRIMKNKRLIWRLCAHIIFLPTFVLISQNLYYFLSESFGFGHLGGSGKVWDIYIPALIYILQFGILHAYQYYQENQRKLILEGELRAAALKSELTAIKAQLNPHFLYNVFNTISASVPPENEQTRQMIAELSDLFRYQLKASQSEVVPLRDELEFVQKYLQLEKARFQDRLEIEIHVPEELLDQPIPPMILQPIVENCVKHGLSSLIKGGKIGISIVEKDDKIRFEITDNGVGVKDKSTLFSKGIGLSNTQLRLQKMYKSSLEIVDNQPSGLTVKFAI